MKFSFDWIEQFAGTGLSAKALALRLTAAGLPVETVMDGDDGRPVLDIDVFANRPDCMNVYGVAREAAAAAGRPLAPYAFRTAEDPAAPAAASLASVAIEDPGVCGRYLARIVSGVTIGPSPDWIVRRLASAGVRPVNNVVDATNFVLWEFGHPMHAFDMETLAGPRILVRRAGEGETLTTLDGVQRGLQRGMPIIADAARPVALAGIMGGAPTMVTDRTTRILIESAWFEPVPVRRASRALSLSTDASYRFERGADPEGALPALDRVCGLIVELAGGRVHPGVLEARPAHRPARRIPLRLGRLASTLGMEVDRERAVAALSSLGFQVRPVGVESADTAGIEAVVPSHRVDIEREADLVEEVARHIGYDAIPERLPHIAGTGSVRRPGHRRETSLRKALSAAGFAEAITSSFGTRAREAAIRPSPAATAAPDGAGDAVALANPISSDQEILRTTLLPGLVSAISHNVNHGLRSARLFEIGRVFLEGKGAPAERVMLAVALTGEARERHWIEPGREAAFHDLSGRLQGVLREAGVDSFLAPQRAGGGLDPACAAAIVARAAGREIALGTAGALGPRALAETGMKQPVYVAEIDLSAIHELPDRAVAFTPLPRYPAVSRDLSLIVRHDQRYADIEGAIQGVAPDRVARVTVFDRYEGGALPAGSVGLSIRVLLQHPDRTMESAEVADLMARILEELGRRCGARLRE